MSSTANNVATSFRQRSKSSRECSFQVQWRLGIADSAVNYWSGTRGAGAGQAAAGRAGLRGHDMVNKTIGLAFSAIVLAGAFGLAGTSAANAESVMKICGE